MSTQITNKQVKIVSNVDFNEKEIENAVIDANKNTIKNVSSKPEVVDRSGPILPERANFNGEKFLNTTDNKLYTGESGGYSLNIGVYNQVTFNESTSVVSDFVYIPTPQGQYNPPTFKGIRRDNCAINWAGRNKILRVHFKLNEVPEDDIKYTILSNALGQYGTPGITNVVEIRLLNKQLYLALYSYQYGINPTTNTLLCNTNLIINQDYYLEVIKNDNNATAVLAIDNYNENIVEINTIETEDNSAGIDGNNYITYGIPANYYAGTQSLSIGEIYLNDSMGDFVIAGGVLIWNNGEDLENDKQYLDKMNNLLYYYHNDELDKVGGGNLEQVTLLSITTEPQGEFAKGSQYYNSTTKLIYIAIDDNIWGDSGENPQFGVIYIYSNDGVTEYYVWDGDNLIETDLEKYQLISNISQNIDETSQTKYTSSYVTNSLKPEIVIKSNNILPQPTDLKVNDTFLNTTNKKIYKVNGIYKWADDVYHNSSVNVDLITGAATDISRFGDPGIARTYTNAGVVWNGDVNYKIKFKQTSSYNNPTIGLIAFINKNNNGTDNVNYYIGFETFYDLNDNKYKIKYVYSSSLRNQLTIINELVCLSTDIELQKEYTLLINKVGTTCTVSLIYDDTVLETNSFQTINLDGNVDNDSLRLGICYANISSSSLVDYLGNRGYIYLLDTSGDFLVPDGEFTWNEIKTLGDYAWCIDKTNKLIYYNNPEKLYKNYIIPDDSGQLGKFLTTNGSTISWGTVTTYQSFNSSWVTNTTFTDFMNSIRDDVSATAGMAYLGELTCSGLPINGNVEAVVEIQNGPSNHKTIHTTITSGTNAPYRWEYTYWNNGNSTSGWIGFQPELPSQSGNNGKFLTTDGSTMSWATVNSGTSDYSSLSNKPSINNVELNGNISLSSLGIQSQNLSFTNKTVSTSDWAASIEYPDYSYECAIPCTGVTANSYAQVIFNPTEASSGNYATVCKTGSGTVTIYSKVNTAITIPTIIVMGA